VFSVISAALVARQRWSKHTSKTIEELLGDGAFYVVRAQMLQAG
jgi:hypothetical protein